MTSWDERAELGTAELWIRAIGFLIWGFIGVSRFGDAAPSWLAMWLCYGVAFVASGFHRRLPRMLVIGLLAAQSAAAITLPWLGFAGYEGLMTSFVAVQVPMVLSLRLGVVWMVVQLPLLIATVFTFKRAVEIMEIVGAYSAFCSFALVVYWLHGQERAARGRLARANAGLLSTRALMLDGVLQGERLRISRELHDSLGHHLTAMSIQLELAKQLVQGTAAEPVGRAQAISKQALVEVRRVVTAMQADDGLDFVASVRALASGIPNPQIHVEATDSIEIRDRDASHALFRCIQEAITNCLRHAQSRNIWVQVTQNPTAIAIVVRDDGSGAPSFVEGSGLHGIRDRVAQLGGAVELGSEADGGFAVRLSVPTDRPARVP